MVDQIGRCGRWAASPRDSPLKWFVSLVKGHLRGQGALHGASFAIGARAQRPGTDEPLRCALAAASRSQSRWVLWEVNWLLETNWQSMKQNETARDTNVPEVSVCIWRHASSSQHAANSGLAPSLHYIPSVLKIMSASSSVCASSLQPSRLGSSSGIEADKRRPHWRPILA